MGLLKCDERGRLVLPQAVRKMYGEAFYLATAAGKIILIPAASDPLKDLQELGRKLPSKPSAQELKKKARDLALRDAMQRKNDR